MEATRKKVKMAEGINNYREQLRSIGAQLASVKLQIADIVTVMRADAVFTPSDEAEVNPLTALVSDPAFDAFVATLKKV